jgi:hypothetical protein
MLAAVTNVPAKHHIRELMKEAAAAGSNTVELAVTLMVFAEAQSAEHAALFPITSSSSSSSGSWFADNVGGLITPSRVFDALQQLAREPLHSSKLLQELLLHTPPAAAAAATAAGPADSSAPAAADADANPFAAAQMLSAVRSYCQQQPALDASQEAVVLDTACAPAAKQRQAAIFVQGPPGTGKTSTLARTTSILVCSGKRVLTCAPTNAAVIESARRSLRLIADARQFAQHAGSGSGLQLRPLSTGDVLLAGDEEKVDPSDPVAAVHLSHRVKRLLGISGRSGLLGTLSEASALLTVEQLFDFKQQCRQQPAGSSSTPAAAFAAFLADSVVAVREQLQAQMKVVAQDMPSDSVVELQQSVQQLLSWLQVLLDCARDDEVSSSTSSSDSSSGSSDTGTSSTSGTGIGSGDTGTSSSDNDSISGTGSTSSGSRSLFDAFTFLKATKGGSAAFGSTAVEPHLVTEPDWLSRWETAAVQLQAIIQRAEEQVPDVLREAPCHNEMQQFCISSCKHLFCTVATAGAPYMGGFLVVVLDEAAQVSSLEACVITCYNTTLGAVIRQL